MPVNTKPDFVFKVSVSQTDVNDLLIGVFESNACGYWLNRIEAKRQPWDKGYDSECLLNAGSWTFTDSETGKKHTVRKVNIVRGLEVMARQYPTHFSDIVRDNTDNVTADVLMQCATFGEVIYG